MLTPLAMKIVLHVYVSPAHFDIPQTEVRDRAIAELADAGLIAGDSTHPSGWEITDKGERFVGMVLDTPFPTLSYIDPRTGVQAQSPRRL